MASEIPQVGQKRGDRRASEAAVARDHHFDGRLIGPYIILHEIGRGVLHRQRSTRYGFMSWPPLAMADMKRPFKGVLFAGLMITDQGPTFIGAVQPSVLYAAAAAHPH